MLPHQVIKNIGEVNSPEKQSVIVFVAHARLLINFAKKALTAATSRFLAVGLDPLAQYGTPVGRWRRAVRLANAPDMRPTGCPRATVP
jgi:hypothetical protein